MQFNITLSLPMSLEYKFQMILESSSTKWKLQVKP